MPTASTQQTSTVMPEEACHRVPVGRAETFLGRLISRMRFRRTSAPYRLDVTGMDAVACDPQDQAEPASRRAPRGGGRGGPVARWRPSWPNRPTRSSAFTLIELIVVIVLLGIIAAVAIPRMSAGADYQATSAARMLAVDIQYAQNHAITTQKKVRVEFDTAANDPSGKTLSRGGYQLVIDEPSASTPIKHPVNKGPYVVSFTKMNEFAALRLDSAKFGPGPDVFSKVVEFDTIGAPDQGGTVVVQASMYMYEISVAAVTGKVTVAAK